ncbi:MAG TPA: Gfo/Idh/MocA family oxidoreductase, partial [Devosia sp.]|nr:Gfo/Idh/MocA family oxidoreductase [Devosia sp.]
MNGPSEKTFGIGIIGCGNISKTYLDLVPLFRGLEVRAVADIAPQVAEARAAEYGTRAQSVDDLLENSELDVILNLTIPDAHYGVTKSIISAGKHAYSEKPLVLSVKEGLDLKKTAEDNGVQVGCAPDTFLGGAHQQARHIVDGGSLGKITSGTCHVMSSGMESWHPSPDFFFRPGGGPILDLGPYYVANLINLLGPVARVTALAGTPKKKRIIGSGPRAGEKVPVSTPTTIHAVLEFEAGALITLGASWDVVAHGHNHMELYGETGTIFLPDPNFFGGKLFVADPGGQKEPVPPWEHPLGIANQGGEGGRLTQANYRAAGLADMMKAIDEGRKARCSLEIALHSLEVLTAILKSAETGTVEHIITSC